MSRLLLLTNEFPPFCGGIATYAQAMACSAHAAGHDVSVLAPRYREMGQAIDWPFPVYRARYLPGCTKFAAYRAVIASNVIRRVRPDVVHAIDMAYLVALWALPLKVPYLASIHGTEVLSFHGRPRSQFIWRKVFGRPDRIVTNSAFTKQLLLSKFPHIEPGRVHAALLGVDRYWFEEPGDATEVARRFSLDPGRMLLITVARLDERKGHRLILRALAALPPSFAKTIDYLIVGAGDQGYLAELRALAAACQARVVFTGALPRDEVRQLYCRADLFCMTGEPHPSRVEGFGLSYLEAAAQGTPSLAASIGGVPEVICDQVTGVLVPPNDLDAVVAAISRFRADWPLAERMGVAARTHARQFSWQRTALETYEFASRDLQLSPTVTPFPVQSHA